MSKAVMGSKVKEDKAKKVTPEKEARVAPRQFNYDKLGNSKNAFWYLDRTDDLEVVTNEASNEAIGVTNIRLYSPSEKQEANGVLLNVHIDTIVGTIKGMQVRFTNDDSGAIFLSEPSRNIAKEGEDAKWLSDVVLDKKVKAQVLSYVETFFEEA